MIGLLRSVALNVAPEFQEEMSYLFNSGRVRGLHLSIDAYWMHYHRLRWQHNAIKYNYDFWGHGEYEEYLEWFLEKRPPDWQQHCVNLGYPEDASPVIFRIIFCHPSDLDEFKELPTYYQDYPISYEARPLCRGVNSTDGVGMYSPDTSGTAGGFLRDIKSNKYYLVSCAHVMGSHGQTVYKPGPADCSNTTAIGTVVLSKVPPENGSNSCNNRTHSISDSLDLALAELNSGVYPQTTFPTFCKPQHVTSFNMMNSNDPVFLLGKYSGRVDAELGSLCVFHAVDIDGKERCFGDIFTITPPHPWYLNTNLVKDGDSGAWIVRTDLGITSWDGMLFASDGSTGYACFAENIMQEVKQYAPNIVLIP